MRKWLWAVALGAIAWGVAVSGIENNPAFAAYLVLLAAVFFLAGLGEDRLKEWRSRAPMLFIGLAAVIGAVVFGVGAYLVSRPAILGESGETEVKPPPIHDEGRVDTTRPRLVASLGDKALVGSDKNGSILVFMMTISNRGAPTAIYQWSAHAFAPGSDVAEAMALLYIPTPNVTVLIGNEKLNSADLIPNKTHQPIPTGGLVQGWLGVQSSKWTTNDWKRPGAHLRIGFKDVFGHEYSGTKQTSK